MSGKYDDIINLPHPSSKRFPRMPLAERAAQFSPFAALTGYDAAIREAGREYESLFESSDQDSDDIFSS
jgi:hypothetical protein